MACSICVMPDKSRSDKAVAELGFDSDVFVMGQVYARSIFPSMFKLMACTSG